MNFSDLHAALSDQLFLTLHASPESYTIVVIQTVIVLALMRPMLQIKALMWPFAPALVLGGLAGIRVAHLSGLPLGEHAGKLLVGSTSGIAVTVFAMVLVIRVVLELLAYRKPLTIETRRA